MTNDRFKELLDQLKTIGLSPNDFAIFGSGPMCVRGLRDAKDLDIIARGPALEIARTAGKESTALSGNVSFVFFDGDIEMFDRWAPGQWDVDQLIDTADIIDGLRYVQLNQVLNWKRTLNRPKDQADIELLERYQQEREN
ncbi:MAG: hypothetical protein V1738_06660 [Patescibacteria group bacterium]